MAGLLAAVVYTIGQLNVFLCQFLLLWLCWGLHGGVCVLPSYWGHVDLYSLFLWLTASGVISPEINTEQLQSICLVSDDCIINTVIHIDIDFLDSPSGNQCTCYVGGNTFYNDQECWLMATGLCIDLLWSTEGLLLVLEYLSILTCVSPGRSGVWLCSCLLQYCPAWRRRTSRKHSHTFWKPTRTWCLLVKRYSRLLSFSTTL